MSTMPQHTQNVRYQSPYLRQQFPPANDPPNKYDEIEHIRQKENQEMMEMQNQIAIRLNQIAKMLQKSTSQQIQPQPQAPIPNPPPPQITKGFLNAIHDKVRSEDEFEDTDNEEAEQHLYEQFLKMAKSKGGRDADSEELMDFCEEYGSDYEEDETDQERETEDEWKKKTQNLCPLKKSKEVFSTADTSIMSIDGIADNVLVTIGKLTIPADFHIVKPHLSAIPVSDENV
ncbi:hypothetical protein PIB30_071520 [Stylosanthes scabra]|uniref:Uncharacterized protein n=1 Tax=Stylosanthes scabra TaxID=79078 RepID=A0ABU6YP59_9FABA|nr:hypothetical protein [Stylosanthes scabra]